MFFSPCINRFLDWWLTLKKYNEIMIVVRVVPLAIDMIYKLQRALVPIVSYQLSPSLLSLGTYLWLLTTLGFIVIKKKNLTLENIFIFQSYSFMLLSKADMNILFQKNVVAMMYTYENLEFTCDLMSISA